MLQLLSFPYTSIKNASNVSLTRLPWQTLYKNTKSPPPHSSTAMTSAPFPNRARTRASRIRVIRNRVRDPIDKIDPATTPTDSSSLASHPSIPYEPHSCEGEPPAISDALPVRAPISRSTPTLLTDLRKPTQAETCILVHTCAHIARGGAQDRGSCMDDESEGAGDSA